MNVADAIDDQAEYERAVADYNEEHQRIDVAPSMRQRLGPFTIACLILNRTIGSGIFVTPPKVLQGTGSVGASLMLWAAGGLLGTTGILCWLELGLSLPLHRIPGTGLLKSVPRSGGEKNYLEFILQRPKFITTCTYGIAFILLGNLTGNALAFGTYIMSAAGHSDPSSSIVRGIAIAALTLSASLHIFSRRGGIVINNVFAVLKVAMVLMIIIVGFIKAGGGLDHMGDIKASSSNFNPKNSFDTEQGSVASYANSFLYVFYTYSGFEQPFYVLGEVSSPRKIFPKSTLITMLVVTTLFVLINVSFFCVIPAEVGLQPQDDMATLFFSRAFASETAKRVMAAFIAVSIFGNILVMTFTAARVKQEIAKEGILPFSLFFATGHTTPWAWIKTKLYERKRGEPKEALNNTHGEQTPMASLGLHWLSSVFLVAITAMLDPETAYSFLVSLYSYVMVVLMGFLSSGGLLYLKFKKSRNWKELRNFRPWLDPLPTLIYFVATGFFLFASFAKPASDYPSFSSRSQIAWYLVPAIGLSAPFWGLLWWACLRLVMIQRRKELVVTRLPYIVPDDGAEGNWIQLSEVVDHEWRAYF